MQCAHHYVTNVDMEVNVMASNPFAFGIIEARPVPRTFPYRVVGAMWSWTLRFRDCPERIFHIVRRTGNLKAWT